MEVCILTRLKALAASSVANRDSDLVFRQEILLLLSHLRVSLDGEARRAVWIVVCFVQIASFSILGVFWCAIFLPSGGFIVVFIVTDSPLFNPIVLTFRFLGSYFALWRRLLALRCLASK